MLMKKYIADVDIRNIVFFSFDFLIVDAFDGVLLFRNFLLFFYLL